MNRPLLSYINEVDSVLVWYTIHMSWHLLIICFILIVICTIIMYIIVCEYNLPRFFTYIWSNYGDIKDSMGYEITNIDNFVC